MATTQRTTSVYIDSDFRQMFPPAMRRINEMGAGGMASVNTADL
jgi:hypothetical protein